MMTDTEPNVLAITLARGGSKSIEKKNIYPINGVPLLAYTVEEAKKSKLIDEYIVSTDDEEIRNVAKEYGAEAPFLRPDHLAADDATSGEALQHAVEWMEENRDEEYDYVVELMATNPMKSATHIDDAIEKIIDTGADSVIGMVQLYDNHPRRIKRIVDDQIVEFGPEEEIGSRRQDLTPDVYLRNGAIYAMKKDALMRTGHKYGHEDSRPLVMPDRTSVNIDEPIDVRIAETVIETLDRELPEPL